MRVPPPGSERLRPPVRLPRPVWWPLPALLLLLAGCVPIPWVAPPVSIDLSGAVATVPRPEGGAGDFDVDGVGRLDVGVRPLGMVPDWADRRFDPSAGFLVEWHAEHRRWDALGGYARVDWRPWQGDGQGWSAAAGPFFAADVLTQDRPGGALAVVPGARVGIRGQVTGWSDGELETGFGLEGGGVGWAWGETGVGVNADVGVRLYPEGPSWQLGVGFSLLLPATAGIFLVPLR